MENFTTFKAIIKFNQLSGVIILKPPRVLTEKAMRITKKFCYEDKNGLRNLLIFPRVTFREALLYCMGMMMLCTSGGSNWTVIKYNTD